MNDYRQVQRTGKPQLSSKHFALNVSRRVIVMIIQPNLAPRDDAPALLCEIEKSLLCLIRKQLRIVRMDADGCIDVLVFFSHLDRAFESPAVRMPLPDIQHDPYAS